MVRAHHVSGKATKNSKPDSSHVQAPDFYENAFKTIGLSWVVSNIDILFANNGVVMKANAEFQ